MKTNLLLSLLFLSLIVSAKNLSSLKPAYPVLQSLPEAKGLSFFAVMYEGSGTMLHDLSLSSVHATLPSSSMWGTGNFDSPDLVINGDDTKVVVLPSASAFKQTGNFSVSCWVKLNDVSAAQCFVSTFGVTVTPPYPTHSWAIGTDDNGSGKVKFFTSQNDPAGTITLSNTVLTTGVWYHIVGTVDIATGIKKIYINGALDATSAAGQMVPDYYTNQHAAIGGLAVVGGSDYVTTQPTQGEIDAVAIYSYDLPLSGGDKETVSGLFFNPFRSVQQEIPRSRASWYIDPTHGNDSNTGRSANDPIATLAKMNSHSYAPGDSVFLKAGETFQGPILVFSVYASADQPVFIGTYGGTAEVTILTGNPDDTYSANGVAGNGRGIHIINSDYIKIVGNIHILGPGADIINGTSTSDRDRGIGADISSSTTIGNQHKGIYFDGLEITECYTGFWLSAEATGAKPDGFESCTFTNLSVHNCLNNGVVFWGGDKLVMDHVIGWYDGIVHSKLVFTNSEVYNIPGDPYYSGEPVTMLNTDSSLIEGVVAHDAGRLVGKNIGQEMGAGAIVLGKSSNSVIRKCEAYNMATSVGVDGCGLDTDASCFNCIIEYNYTHDNQGPGYQVVSAVPGHLTTGSIVRYNVSVNDCRNPSPRQSQGAIMLYSAYDAKVYGNTVILQQVNAVTHAPACIVTMDNVRSASDVHATIANNIFQTEGTSTFISSPESRQVNVKILGNFYSTTTPNLSNQGTPTWQVAAGTVYHTLSDFRAAGYETLEGNPVGAYGDPLLKNSYSHPVMLPESSVSNYTGVDVLENSPAIQLGIDLAKISLGPNGGFDFAGNALPATGPLTAGAIQYNLITGLERENSNNNLLVYPSPSSGIINLQPGNDFTISHITIVNSIGQIVYEKDIVSSDENIFNINLSGQKGLFIVSLKTDNKRYSQTIILE